MQEFLAFELVYGITVRELGYLLGLALAGLLLAWIVNLSLAAVAARSRPDSIRTLVVEAMRGPVRWALITAGLWFGYVMMVASPDQHDATEMQYQVFLASELPWLMWFGLRLTDNLSRIWAARAAKTESTFDDQLVPIVRATIKLGVFVTGILLIIQNLGGEVGSVIAGLGIGGAAVALASKDTLANVFGSLVIFVDRPFTVGDLVEIGSTKGIVEEVGLRVTRIRTPSNSLITVPNATLTTTAINNLSRMRKRRFEATLRLATETQPDQLVAAVQGIREALLSDERIAKDSVQAHLSELAAGSYDVQVSAYVLTAKAEEYAAVREQLLLEFMRRLHGLGVELK